jgi:glycosyltransferase involved in cell wall biosynthesis
MKKKKLILFLSPLPPPYYGSAMSSETCLNVLKNSNKYEIKNLKVNYSKEFSDIDKINFKKLAGYFLTLYKIICYSLKYQPQLVYIMPATSGFAFIRDFSYALISKSLNKNIIYHMRTQITNKEKNNKIMNFIFHKAFKNSRVIFLGKELKEDVLPYLNNSETFILPNTINNSIKEHDYLKIEEDRLQNKKLRLIFISNMMKSKGWHKTILAATILNQQNIDFSLCFAGNWPSDNEKDEFFNEISKYSLQKKVKYLGHINEKQKIEILSHSDVMIFPTEYPYEALPRVIIEAYQYGIPVISTRNGSIPSMINHEQTGYLLEDISPIEIAKYILKFSDKNRLINMGRLARQRFLSNYEISVFSKNFEHIIAKCL